MSSSDDPRSELARIARAARLLVAGEREGGIVAITGMPGAAPRLVGPDSVGSHVVPANRSGGSGSPGNSGRGESGGGRPAPSRGAVPTSQGSGAARAPETGQIGLSGRAAAAAAAGAIAVGTTPSPAPGAAPARPVARPQSEPGAHFTPNVRPLDLPADCLSAFGDLPARIEACRDCVLGGSRTQTVFGEGAIPAELVFCGEAPGYDEDRSGRPFVGAAGELLSAMIERGLRMRREDVFILNTLKCRPPRNRAPLPAEVKACRPHLEEQLAVLRPKVIVALGNHAVRAVLGESSDVAKMGITKIRGQIIDALGTKVIPTFHPAYLLRNPAAKRDAWQDLQTVMRVLGKPLR